MLCGGGSPRRRALAVSLALPLAALAAAACSPPSAPEPPAPRSVVLITIDTLRADYVNARITPALDRLRSQSIVFENAITVAPLTLPAHASLLTGLYPPRHGVRDNHLFTLSADVPTYPALLRARGYATAAFVSAIVLDSRYGLDRGFDVYDDEMTGPERSAADTLTRAGRWIESARAPSFIWIHLFEPHAPYKAGSYEAEVSLVDREIGRFFDFLRARGLLESAVVSVTSDHGEALGDHGEQTHGFFVYDATLRIPWMLRAPGQKARSFSPQVRIVDVMPTVLELAASLSTGSERSAAPDVAQAFRPAGIDGFNLVPFLEKGASPHLEAYAETFLPRHQFNWSELRTFRGERLKLIEAPEAELYDITSDAAEMRNLARVRPDEVAQTRRQLAALERGGAPASRPIASDPVEAEKFMSLGYIGYSPTGPGDGTSLPDPKQKLEVYRLTMSALELSESRRIQQALAALRRAESLDPRVAQVHFLKGVILGNAGRFPEAAAALERTVSINPRYVTARFKLALAYVRLGDHARAERALAAVLNDEPRNFRAIHNLAAVAYARGDLARAETLEREALAIDPTYFEAWNTLGAIYVVMKRPQAAVEALNIAVRLNPASGQALYNLALALRAAGQMDEAKAASERACSLDNRYCQGP